MAKALLLCCLLVLAGCASARELQQQQQQAPDLGGLVNQIGQVASQGIQSVIQNSNQGAGRAGNGSRPLGGIGDALQNLGASLNNRTGTAGGRAPGAAPAASSAAPQQPDNSLLADPAEITQNVTGGLGSILNNVTSALGNATRGGAAGAGAGAGAAAGTGGSQAMQEGIKPPPGIKSAAGTSALSQLASLAAAAVLLLQLLA